MRPSAGFLACLIAALLVTSSLAAPAKLDVNWVIPPQVRAPAGRSWDASTYTLRACKGDSLAIHWSTPISHGLATTSAAAWSSCSLSGYKNVAGTKVGKSGKKTVKLAKAGTTNYICQVPGHCASGHKMKVITSNTAC